jgi:hypothetical protein
MIIRTIMGDINNDEFYAISDGLQYFSENLLKYHRDLIKTGRNSEEVHDMVWEFAANILPPKE